MSPDWPKIIALAQSAGRRLGNGKKPGLRTRSVYRISYVAACQAGYSGTELDWEIFIRRRG